MTSQPFSQVLKLPCIENSQTSVFPLAFYILWCDSKVPQANIPVTMQIEIL